MPVSQLPVPGTAGNPSSSLLAGFGDSPAIDAFGRLRSAEPFTLFDSKQISDDGDIANSAENYPLFFDNQETSGGGTSTTFNANRASTTLAVGATTAGTRVRQTFQRFNYQPGKSQAAYLTGILGTGVAGITRRYGLFDGNNGLFFELRNTTLAVVRRSNATGSAVDTRVTQANWNLDRMDGTGPSGVTIDTSKTQIYFVDYEWLGVGRVRFGFVVDGGYIYCHEINNANNLNVVYMSTPNLPVRAEISNDGTGPAATLEQICVSVVSEGGVDPKGVTHSHDNGSTAVAVAGLAGARVALLGIRLRSSHLGVEIIPEIVNSMATTANDDYALELVWNPTVAGRCEHQHGDRRHNLV
jgi:hypothetical protein